MAEPINNDDFKRVMTILYGVWQKAGHQALADGLKGEQVVRAQEAVMTAFLAHIDEQRRAR